MFFHRKNVFLKYVCFVSGSVVPKFVVSTSNKMYLYTKSDQADSKKGFRIKYHEGCSAVINAYNGTVLSPAYNAAHADEYPANQECVYRIIHPEGGKLSLMFDDFDVHPSDKVEVLDGQVPLHDGDGFTGSELPNFLMTAESGEMTVRFTSDAVKNTVSC